MYFYDSFEIFGRNFFPLKVIHQRFLLDNKCANMLHIYFKKKRKYFRNYHSVQGRNPRPLDSKNTTPF